PYARVSPQHLPLLPRSPWCPGYGCLSGPEPGRVPAELRRGPNAEELRAGIVLAKSAASPRGARSGRRRSANVRPLRVALVHPYSWPDVRRGGERYLADLAWY